MIYTRKYIQFNDLVFDEFDMIREVDNSSTTFKVNSTEYSYSRGSYVAFKSGYLNPQETEISMTIRLNMNKLPCEMREFYSSFVIEQLNQPGKLWAIKNNTLVWAYAYVSSYSEIQDSPKDTLELDVDFVLYEGVWHKANRYKTFLTPFDICTFMDCLGYKEIPCKPLEEDCCVTCKTKPIAETGCLCCCPDITKEMALCYSKEQLQDMYKYGCSTNKYKIVYDCVLGEKLFGDTFDKVCSKTSCDGVIAGMFYSDTDIPTEGITIRLEGKMKNPYVEINGNGNYIEGEFDGTLVIHPNGDVYYGNDCCLQLIEPSWRVPSNMSYGWKVKPRNNRLIVHMGTCCAVCVYFEIDALTL